MKTRLLASTFGLALTLALCAPLTAQISGTIAGNAFYDQRVYLSGNLTINGRASFDNGVEVAAGTAAPTLSVVGNTVIRSLAGTTAAPLRNLTVTGELDLNGPVTVVDNARITGPLITRRGVDKISAGSITITGDLTLANEQTLILETNGGDVTIGGNLIAPINTAERATLVVSARNGGTLRFTGSRDARVTLSASSGSSVGTPLYPVNMSLRTDLNDRGFIIGFVVSNPDGGAGSVTSRFLIRAVGPGLARFGVGGVAEAPMLTVNARQSLTATDWSTDPSNRAAVQDAISKSGAFPIEVGSRDAAIVLDLPPGTLTVSVKTTPGTRAGEAIVEVYRVP